MELDDDFVLEEDGDKGVYLIDGRIRKSNTSEISYSFGIDKQQVRTQFIEPGVKEVIRRIKSTGKVPSQKDAVQIAYEGIKKNKELYTVFGTEMHKAFENFDNNLPVVLPTPKHQAYFQGFLYFEKHYKPQTIFTEKRLDCPHCELTTQIDRYALVNNLYTIIDYKTGRTVGPKTPIQLAINKHVLEHNDYKVDQTWAVHVQDFLAYPVPFELPWEEAEIVLKNAQIKERLLKPKIYVREFADRTEGQKENAPEEAFKIQQFSEVERVVLDSISQGHQSLEEVQDTSSTIFCQDCKQLVPPGDICLCQADKLYPETEKQESPLVQVKQTRQRGRPKGSLNRKTLERTEETPRRTPIDAELDPEAVVAWLQKNPTLRDAYENR